MRNRVSLDDSPHMPVGAIAALPPDQLALLMGEAAEALERAQRIKDWLDGAVDLKYRDRAAAARAAKGKSTGTIRFADGDFIVVADLPKRVRWDQATITPDPHPAPTAPAAARLFEDLDEEITRRQRQAIGSGHGAVLARVWENTAKVALIKAVSANPAEPIIRVEDAEWARDVVAHCVETLLTEAERHIADNDTERNHKRVLEIIRGAGEQGFTKSELIRRTQFLDKRQRDDILEALVDSGQIGTAMRATATKPVMVLRVTKETPAK